MRRPWSATAAWAFVDALLSAPGLGLLVETERHAMVARMVLTEMPEIAGNLMHDTHTAILMREHGISRILTRDSDFSRFPFLEVVDPLRL
jgi:predicted nucleic acid-binding protein